MLGRMNGKSNTWKKEQAGQRVKHNDLLMLFILREMGRPSASGIVTCYRGCGQVSYPTLRQQMDMVYIR